SLRLLCVFSRRRRDNRNSRYRQPEGRPFRAHKSIPSGSAQEKPRGVSEPEGGHFARFHPEPSETLPGQRLGLVLRPAPRQPAQSRSSPGLRRCEQALLERESSRCCSSDGSFPLLRVTGIKKPRESVGPYAQLPLARSSANCSMGG